MNDTDATAVSIVMAVYNGKAFLAPQMQSVLAEMQPQDELVVVDDASSDGSSAWLSAIVDQRIVLRRHERNQGVRRSFENGLLAARHDIVFLCDQDDLWLRGKRAAIVDAFACDARCMAVVSDAQVIDADGRIVAASFMATRGGFHGGFWSTVVRNRYLGCAMAVRRPVMTAALPIPRYVPMHDIWIGALASLLGQVRYLPQPLIQYRRHGKNLSPGSHQSLGQMLRWRIALLCAVALRMAALPPRRTGTDKRHLET